MEKILEQIKNEINNLKITDQPINVGRIIEVADGIVKASGLSGVAYNEIVELPNNLIGLAINLEEFTVGIIVLGDYTLLKEGDTVKSTGKILSIPVGEELLGRVINPVGQPLDGKGPLTTSQSYPIEKIAPNVIDREPVNTPLQTGIIAIDTMIPIGRGQRELIIGDRGLGKTAIAIDTIINQKDSGVICIYTAIGQKTSKIAQIIATLEKYNALEYTIVVSASASDPASLNFIAPYAACAIGEYFMDSGKDALVIYDDLTKHAWAYREISLNLRRPSGREAYPGDIFYLHSRLLERAAKLNKSKGSGSLTALPIIETQAGDVSAYIPTNVISITDGQIYLESDLFWQEVRPAINVGLSVSRVGGAAQIKAMKQVAGSLRLDLAQYRELASFAQFGSDLDEKTRLQLERGKRIVEILKQSQYKPLPVELQVVIVWTVTQGLIDDIEVEKVQNFKEKLIDFLLTKERGILKQIKDKNELDEKITGQLEKIVRKFKQNFQL